MTKFTTEQYLDYLRKRASPELAREIRQACRPSDSEVAFELGVLRSMLGLPEPRTIPDWLFSKAVVAVAACLLGGIAGWITHSFLPRAAPPDPEAGKDGPPPGAHTRWEVGRPTVRVEKDFVALLNRGSMITVDEFPAPFELRFDWRWVNKPGDSDYPENLHVILHTEGKHKPVHNFRMADGIEITLMSANGHIRAVAESIKTLGQTPEHAVDLSEGQWHTVRIIDDGRQISVFVHRRGEPSGKPLLTARHPGNFPKHRVAVFNRELIGGRPHETHIANFTVRPLPKGKDAAD